MVQSSFAAVASPTHSYPSTVHPREAAGAPHYPVPTRGGRDDKHSYRALAGRVIGISTI